MPNLHPQDACWRLRRQAELEEAKGRLDDALRLLQKAEDMWSSMDGVYHLSCLFSRTGRHVEAICKLRVALEGEYVTLQMLESDDDLEALRPMPDFDELIVRAKLIRRAAIGRVRNPALRRQLLDAAALDQEARTRVISDPGHTARMVEIDHANANLLATVCDQYGWPTRSLVGGDGAEAAWLVAQHSDADIGTQERFLVELRAAVAAGEASPAHLAYLEDRVESALHGTQFYGTQLGAGLRLVPIRKPEALEERRAVLGLPPSWYYLEHLTELQTQMTSANKKPALQDFVWT